MVATAGGCREGYDGGDSGDEEQIALRHHESPSNGYAIAR
jgi:hypothetical protein